MYSWVIATQSINKIYFVGSKVAWSNRGVWIGIIFTPAPFKRIAIIKIIRDQDLISLAVLYKKLVSKKEEK
jgi:hypothetical protein